MSDSTVFFALHFYEFPTAERAAEARKWVDAGNADADTFSQRFPDARQKTHIGGSQTLRG
jgi:hypothetical protein